MANAVSQRERVSHVVRRLSMGTHPDLLADLDRPSDAVDRALDLSAPGAPLLEMRVPVDFDDGSRRAEILTPLVWWVERMSSPDRMIEERLVWFWHDHFATSIAKVPSPYLMWQQQLTIRAHATGSFAELLKAMSRDPAMLIYLDGLQNASTNRNENFGRECLELFTMGRDAGYTQDDVVAASRAFTGWFVNLPGRTANIGAPWTATLLRGRFDAGDKTLLGTSGPLDMDGALDVVLAHPATATFIVTKLYRELVGVTPDDKTLARLAKSFRRDYQIMPLVESIVRADAFTADATVRSKYRSPVEKVVAIMQASGATRLRPVAPVNSAATPLLTALRTMSSMPFLPPNVGGYPKGERLSGPGNLVHTFDLLQAIAAQPPASRSVDTLFARFGVFDVSDDTRRVVKRQRDPAARFALALTSPEVTLT